jgi:hypothetical protein
MHDYPTPPKHQQYLMQLQLPLGAIVKIPKGGQTDAQYKSLICTDEDKALIFELITTLAENSKFTLLMKQSHLKQIGIQINHVHPFRFLGTIFSHPRLKACMRDIFDDYFKRGGFMDGLGPSLSREASKGKLSQYIEDFAQEVSVFGGALRQIYSNKEWSGSDWETKDWEKLVRFLIES